MGGEASSEIRTRCVCPKCGDIHYMLLNWTGRGEPKKFCPPCKHIQESFEDLTELPIHVPEEGGVFI